MISEVPLDQEIQKIQETQQIPETLGAQEAQASKIRVRKAQHSTRRHPRSRLRGFLRKGAGLRKSQCQSQSEPESARDEVVT